MVCAIEEEQSLTRASERLHLTLPAVSARVKNLEDHFGIRLIYRERSGVRLTSAGEALARRARSVLREATLLLLDLEGFAEGIEGQIRVFANTTAVSEFLPEVIQKFLHDRPNIAIDLRERLNPDIVRAVIDGAADVGIIAGKVPMGSLEAIHFATDRLIVAVPKDHDLAGASDVAFSATLDYPHIMLPETSSLFAFLTAAAADLGKRIRIRVQMQSFETMCRMIESNVGIGILPTSCAQRAAKHMRIELVPLSDAWAVRERFIIVRSLAALPRFAQEFVQSVKLLAGQRADDAPKIVLDATERLSPA